jgi:hypothetical protein
LAESPRAWKAFVVGVAEQAAWAAAGTTKTAAALSTAVIPARNPLGRSTYGK